MTVLLLALNDSKVFFKDFCLSPCALVPFADFLCSFPLWSLGLRRQEPLDMLIDYVWVWWLVFSRLPDNGEGLCYMPCTKDLLIPELLRPEYRLDRPEYRVLAEYKVFPSGSVVSSSASARIASVNFPMN